MPDAPGPAAAPRWADRLHAALSRVTSGGAYLPAIDGLRFVSIFAVLVYHTGVWTEFVGRIDDWSAAGVVARTASVGCIGVQIFFAISGYVLARPFLDAAAGGRAPPGLRDYYVRRVSRIEPPFVICVLALFALQCLRRAGTGEPAPGLDRLLATLGYAHGPIYREVSPIDPVTWSLEVEVRFYLVAPFLFRAYLAASPALRRAVLVGVAAAVAAATTVWSARDHGDEASLWFQCPWFLAGLLAADLQTGRTRDRESASVAWDVAAAAAGLGLWLSLLTFLGSDPDPLRALHGAVRPACVCVLLVAAFRARAWRAALELRWIAVVGGMCYSIYLWHYPLMRVVQGHLPRVSDEFLPAFAVHAAVLVPVTVAVCAVLFVLFEKPFMRRDWVSRAVSRLRGRA